MKSSKQISCMVFISLAAVALLISLAVLFANRSDRQEDLAAPPSTAASPVDAQPELDSNTALPQPQAPASAPNLPLPESNLPTSVPLASASSWVELKLSELTLADKIGQMIMMGVSGQAISVETCSLLQDVSPGSIVYVGENVTTPDQLRAFSTSLQSCNAGTPAAIPLWIAMDHEGQYVDRFVSGATVFPSAMAVGATGDPDLAYQAALASGNELAYSGVNLVLGPDADVLVNFDNDVISLRSYGADPSQVSQFVAQAVRGYQAAHLVTALKHFPGHGGTAADSHTSLPVDDSSQLALNSTYLPPFRAGIQAGAPLVMFSHVAFPSIDPSGLPASLSAVFVSLLRQEMGFQGVILTDALGMGAISASATIPQASLQAVLAGVNMLLITSPAETLATRDVLLAAVQEGQIPLELIDDSVRRILTIKAAWGQTSYPLPAAPEPDWQADAELAYQTGYRSVAVIRDEAGLLPGLPGINRLLVVGPQDAWGLYATLQSALESSGVSSDVVMYSGPWNGLVTESNYFNSLPVYAQYFDAVLVLTWQAHHSRLLLGDAFQGTLVENLLATEKPVIVAALKSPVDILEFPQATVYLATFGTTAGQLQALADALGGSSLPRGVNPLPALP